jgi:hypothetical protein
MLGSGMFKPLVGRMLAVFDCISSNANQTAWVTTILTAL